MMKPYQINTSLVIACFLLFFPVWCAGPAHGQPSGSSPAVSEFTPGIGEAVGYIIKVRGSVLLMHAEKDKVFYAKAEMPLFRGDTLKSMEDGLVSFLLNDGSQLTLASETTIVINQSLYDPSKKERASFIGMGLGKIRCWIKKMKGFNRSEFKVKTKTAILGVRGSDFVIISKAKSTEIFTLDDTRLEVLGLAAPDIDPLVLSDFEKTIVGLGQLPADIESVPKFEADRLKRELPLVRGPQVEKRFEEIGVRVPQKNLVTPPPTGEIEASSDESDRSEQLKFRTLEEENFISDKDTEQREEGGAIPPSDQAPQFPLTPDKFDRQQ